MLVGFQSAFALARWQGSDFGDPLHPPSLTFTYTAGAAVFTISTQDLATTTDTLRLWAGATDNIDDPANFDSAPEFGLYTYPLAPKPQIKAVLLPGTVLFPAPGKVLSTRGVQLRLTSGETVRPDRISCTLTIAGKTLKPLPGGCKWRIPQSAAGKRGPAHPHPRLPGRDDQRTVSRSRRALNGDPTMRAGARATATTARYRLTGTDKQQSNASAPQALIEPSQQRARLDRASARRTAPASNTGKRRRLPATLVTVASVLALASVIVVPAQAIGCRRGWRPPR